MCYCLVKIGPRAQVINNYQYLNKCHIIIVINFAITIELIVVTVVISDYELAITSYLIY